MTTPSLPLDKGMARKLSAGLGWFSLGLGAAQLAVPGHINSLIGVRDTGGTRMLQRLFGAQEVGMGMGIFSAPRRDLIVSSRVAGDAVHISLMAASLSSKHTNRARAATTLAVLGGVAALDAVTAASLRAAAPSGEYALHATYATTINRPVNEVYDFWRDFSRLPSFMRHLESVEVLSETRSRWTAKAPAGRTVSWEAEIVEDEPNAKIAWRSVNDADVANAGHVRFRPAPADQGTEVSVTIDYTPPLGYVGAGVALLAGEDPRQQIQEDLLRLKQVMEVGEVVVSHGTIDGATLHQHPAQPAER